MFKSTKISGIARGICRYSTKPDEKLFLSDLLNRIEKINTQSKKIMESKRTSEENNRFVKTENKTTPQKKVVVADHPLASKKFRQAASNSKQNGTGSKNQRFREPREPRAQRTQEQDGRDRKARPAGEKRAAAARPARSGARRRDSSQQVKRLNTKQNAQTLGSKPATQSKTLKSVPYAPLVNANTFFYGKIASVNSCLTSRVASVAKEQLIASKYPYKVPKEIIDNLDDTLRNPYLLQKDFSLEVNSDDVTQRVREVVKGQWEDLKVDSAKFSDKKNLELAEFTKNELMKNGDLTLHSKSVIFEVGNGLKSPKELLKNAHWVKA